jgi:hypothetical protein
MNSNHLTLTRQELYELVWSRPMVDVAKDFHVSDVALAKRCKAVDVPVPPRGWWAKKTAGQDPAQTPLPKYRERREAAADRCARREPVAPVREGPEPAVVWQPRPPKVDPAAHPEWSDDERAFRERIEAAAAAVVVPEGLALVTAAARRTAVELKAARVKDFKWASGERVGPVLRIAVSEALELRALRVADALVQASEQLGWVFDSEPAEKTDRRPTWPQQERQAPAVGRLFVDGEPMQLRFMEPDSRRVHEQTEAEERARRLGQYVRDVRWDFTPSGRLLLQLISHTGHVFHTLRDSRRSPIEGRVSDILHRLRDKANAVKAYRAEQEREEAARQERQRLAWELQERQETQRKYIHELERQAGAWYRVRLLRRYVLAAERAVGVGKTQLRFGEGEPFDFLSWAQGYVAQLDPLSGVADNVDQRMGKSERWNGADERVAKFWARVLGVDGEVGVKLGMPAGDAGDPVEGDDEE